MLQAPNDKAMRASSEAKMRRIDTSLVFGGERTTTSCPSDRNYILQAATAARRWLAAAIWNFGRSNKPSQFGL
jgi:hypothetical protein